MDLTPGSSMAPGSPRLAEFALALKCWCGETKLDWQGEAERAGLSNGQSLS